MLASVAASLLALAGASCSWKLRSKDLKMKFGGPPGRWHQNVLATCFWVGEPGNRKSAWDPEWLANFGGVDDPQKRNGLLPAGFVPRQNVFYCALPYNDVAGRPEARSKMRGRWVQVRANGKTCYCQWEDVGPWHTDDKAYVLGNARPRAEKDARAGIDLSPAANDYLDIRGKGRVDWRFVRADGVPPGPWLRVITGHAMKTSTGGK